MLAGVERLPFSSWTLWWSCLALCLINWMSPVDSDDPWQRWTFTSSGQHGLSSRREASNSFPVLDILPAFGVFVFVFNFIYLLLFFFLAASDLGCSRQGLCCIMQDLFLWHSGSVVETHGPSCYVACGILVPARGSNRILCIARWILNPHGSSPLVGSWNLPSSQPFSLPSPLPFSHAAFPTGNLTVNTSASVFWQYIFHSWLNILYGCCLWGFLCLI